MLTIEYAKDPIWANSEGSAINMIVKFIEMAEELPFTGVPNDPMPYCVELFNNAVAGDYGTISAYIPPPPPTAQQNKAKATQLLYQTDWTSEAAVADPAVSNPYLMNQSEFLAYRSAVREIAINPVAGVITWPTKPQEVWSN
jgi:hypothetical protein